MFSFTRKVRSVRSDDGQVTGVSASAAVQSIDEGETPIAEESQETDSSNSSFVLTQDSPVPEDSPINDSAPLVDGTAALVENSEDSKDTVEKSEVEIVTIEESVHPIEDSYSNKLEIALVEKSKEKEIVPHALSSSSSFVEIPLVDKNSGIRIIDIILKDTRENLKNDMKLPATYDYPKILKRVLNTLDNDWTAFWDRDHSKPVCTLENPRQRELFQIAPFLCFTEPSDLVERADGFLNFISGRDNTLTMNSLTSGVLSKLEALQHRFKIFGVPYREWSRLGLCFVTGEAMRLVSGDEKFSYDMPWGDLLLILTQKVSVTNEFFNLKYIINAKNYKKHELAGPFIRESLVKIKALPPIIDKNLSLGSLKKFVRKHVLPLGEENFIHSIDNFDILEDAITKLNIRFDLKY